MCAQKCDSNKACPQHQPTPNAASARSPTRSPRSACAFPEAWSSAPPAAALPAADATATPATCTAPTRSWIRKVGAKTFTRTLSPAQLERYRPLFDNTKRLRELISELETALSRSRRASRRMGQHRKATAAVTSATAKTPLQITCPRRSPGPAAVTAKTPQNGLEITAGLRARPWSASPRPATTRRTSIIAGQRAAAVCAGIRGGKSGQVQLASVIGVRRAYTQTRQA